MSMNPVHDIENGRGHDSGLEVARVQGIKTHHSVLRAHSVNAIVETGGVQEVEGVADQFEIWCKMNNTLPSSVFNQAQTEESTVRNYLYTTGFLRKVYEFKDVDKIKSVGLAIDYMRNWTYSWNFLVLHSENVPTSFQIVSPLLNACVTIFFDRYLLRWVTVLSLYCILGDIITLAVHHQDSWYYATNIFVISMLLFSVWQGYFVVKGSKPTFVSNRNYHKEKLIVSKLTPSSACWLVVRYFGGYLNSLKIDESKSSERKVRKSGDYQTEGFLEVCSAATEYLMSVGGGCDWDGSTGPMPVDDPAGIAMQALDSGKIRSSGMRDDSIATSRTIRRPLRGSTIQASPEAVIAMPSFPQFRPRRYTNITIVVSIIIFPLAFLCNCAVSAFFFLPAACRNDDVTAPYIPNPSCTSYALYAKLSVYFIIPNFVYTWLTICLGVILSALLYGADLANALAVNWNLRFLPLRRMRQCDRLVQSSTMEGATDDEDDEFLAFVNDFQGASNKQELVDLLRESISARNSKVGGGANRSDQGIQKTISWMKLVGIMNRDAVERYLFMQHYFGLCAEIWGPFIATSVAVCAITLAFNYALALYIFVKMDGLAIEPIFLVGASLVIFSILLASLSYANSAAETIWNSFNGAGKDDFEVIGGRESWKDYVNSSPVQWTVFGMAVTKKQLVYYAFYFASAIVSSGFISYISKSSTGTDKGL
jgi:hypothetical protein